LKLKTIDLEKYQHETYMEYYLGLFPKYEQKYENSYIWNFIQNDIVYELCKNKRVIIEINDFEFNSIYDDYPRIKLSEGETNSFNKNLINLECINKEIILDFLEGTSIWDYADIINFYCYESNNFNDGMFKFIEKDGLEKSNYFAKIFPTGDNLGLSIISKSQDGLIIDIIREVLLQYSVTLNIIDF